MYTAAEDFTKDVGANVKIRNVIVFCFVPIKAAASAGFPRTDKLPLQQSDFTYSAVLISPLENNLSSCTVAVVDLLNMFTWVFGILKR